MKPTSNSKLAASYFQTDYSFMYGTHTIIIRPGEANRSLLEFLENERVESWAYITAWNPHSVLMSEAFNRQQQEQLLQKVKKFKVYRGKGKAGRGTGLRKKAFLLQEFPGRKPLSWGGPSGKMQSC